MDQIKSRLGSKSTWYCLLITASCHMTIQLLSPLKLQDALQNCSLLRGLSSIGLPPLPTYNYKFSCNENTITKVIMCIYEGVNGVPLKPVIGKILAKKSVISKI